MNKHKSYWEGRYRAGQTRWDIGRAAPALTAFADRLEDPSCRILLPGAGRGHEAEYLFKTGFTDLTVLDIASEPLAAFQERVPDFPHSRLVETDFFTYHGGPFDLVLEHTFFCSLPPELRPRYVQKMHELLVPGGRLAGLLFDFPLSASGPPYGGSETEYRKLFSEAFKIIRLERARNSIPPRQGNELFFIFERK